MTAIDSGMATALKYVGELKDRVHDAEAPKVIELKHEPPGTYAIWDGKRGMFTERVGKTPPRHYEAGSVDAVVKLIDELWPVGFTQRVEVKEDGTMADGAPMPNVFVFVQNGSVVVILDEKGARKERVTISLTMAPAFKLLRDLATAKGSPEDRGGPWMKQKDMIDLLRTELAARYFPENLIAVLRKLKFDTTASGESSVTTGRESMGKQVEARVAGLDGGNLEAIETVVVRLPVYVDLLDPARDYRVVEFDVTCSFDVDTTTAKFRLRPRAGEIERALLEADRRIMQDIEANLKDRSRVRVFRGAPRN